MFTILRQLLNPLMAMSGRHAEVDRMRAMLRLAAIARLPYPPCYIFRVHLPQHLRYFDHISLSLRHPFAQLGHRPRILEVLGGDAGLGDEEEALGAGVECGDQAFLDIVCSGYLLAREVASS